MSTYLEVNDLIVFVVTGEGIRFPVQQIHTGAFRDLSFDGCSPALIIVVVVNQVENVIRGRLSGVAFYEAGAVMNVVRLLVGEFFSAPRAQ